MKIRNTIPFALLLILSFVIGMVIITLLSGRIKSVEDSFNKGKEDAKQQLQQWEAQPTISTPSPTSEQQVENINDLFHDLTLLTSLKAGLDEQYNFAKSQKASMMDSGWLRDFNAILKELSNRYQGVKLETEKAKFYISIAIGDLSTLSQEYESSLKGKDGDINFFSNSFEENIVKVQENL